MLVGALRSPLPEEKRVGITPDIVRRYLADGHQVVVEPGAGQAAGFDDDAYREAGCEVGEAREAEAVIAAHPPDPGQRKSLRPGSLLIGLLAPLDDPPSIRVLAECGVTALAFETLPRATRAQSMDALTSQASLAGYQLALEAAALLPRVFAMMVTPAGTLRPAKAVVLGCGVAGLSAISTARRLGAVVRAFDVREEAAEDVKSLGADFIEAAAAPPDGSAAGGYARTMNEDESHRLREALIPHLSEADAVITTAAVPGRPAPLLVGAEAVRGMAPGSVIVDGAASRGGNCRETEAGRTKTVNGVTVSGPLFIESRMATDSSRLYARNAYELVKYLTADPAPGPDDPIVAGVTLAKDGEVVHPAVLEQLGGGQ